MGSGANKADPRKTGVKYIEGDDQKYLHPAEAFTEASHARAPVNSGKARATARVANHVERSAVDAPTSQNVRAGGRVASHVERPAVDVPNPLNSEESRWTCPRCDEVNKSSRFECDNCGCLQTHAASFSPPVLSSPVRVRAPTMTSRGVATSGAFGLQPTVTLGAADLATGTSTASTYRGSPRQAMPTASTLRGSPRPTMPEQTSPASPTGPKIPPSNAVLSTKRFVAEQSALDAIRAAFPNAPTVANEEPEGLRGLLELKSTTPFKKKWTVEVNINGRKVMNYWLKHARRRVNDRRAARQARMDALAARKMERESKRARLDNLIQMYADNEDELDRLCMEEPDDMIRAQMEILSHRIDALDGPKARRRRRTRGEDEEAEMRAAVPSNSMDSDEEEEEDFAIEQSWSEMFDAALKKHEDWKTHCNAANRIAAASAANRKKKKAETSVVPAPRDAHEELVEQLRAERERLAALLPLFDAKVRKQRQREEQQTIDMVEQMAEARRAAEEAQIEELREQRRRERQEREEKQRRREAEEAERRRKEEEERQRWAEEQQRREIERQRAEAEEDRIRLEMEERLRQEQERQRREEFRRQEEERRREEERQREEERRREEEERERRRSQAFETLGEVGPGATSSTTPSGGGARDFLQRALAALGDDADASSSEEEEEDTTAGDLQLIKASEVIAAKLQRAASQRERSNEEQ